MSQGALIIFLATIIGILYLIKIRSYDIYEKEPFFKLLLVMLLGGVISIMTSSFLYFFTSVKYNMIDAIIKIGMIEETSKLIALILIFRLIKDDFNEIVDGIIYITAISLGFAIIENIFYAIQSKDPFLILFQRSLFSVIGHISFSGYMGIAYYIHKKIHKNYIGLILAVLIAALAHGFYDGFIFHQELSFFFHFVFIALFILQFRLLKTALGFSGFRELLTSATFKESEGFVLVNCCNCNNSSSSIKLNFEEINSGICNSCKNMVFDQTNVNKLFKYFRPIMNSRKILRKYPKHPHIVSLDTQYKVLYNNQNHFLSANADDLGKWLNIENSADQIKILSFPVFGVLLKHIGLKYLISKQISN